MTRVTKLANYHKFGTYKLAAMPGPRAKVIPGTMGGQRLSKDLLIEHGADTLELEHEFHTELQLPGGNVLVMRPYVEPRPLAGA